MVPDVKKRQGLSLIPRFLVPRKPATLGEKAEDENHAARRQSTKPNVQLIPSRMLCERDSLGTGTEMIRSD